MPYLFFAILKGLKCVRRLAYVYLQLWDPQNVPNLHTHRKCIWGDTIQKRALKRKNKIKVTSLTRTSRLPMYSNTAFALPCPLRTHQCGESKSTMNPFLHHVICTLQVCTRCSPCSYRLARICELRMCSCPRRWSWPPCSAIRGRSGHQDAHEHKALHMVLGGDILF